MDIQGLQTEINRRRSYANLGSKAWSTAFYLTFGMSTIAGVVVATMLGRHDTFGFSLNQYIPVIAMIGSICSAAGIFGGFDWQWKANRITMNRLDILRIGLKY